MLTDLPIPAAPTAASIPPSCLHGVFRAAEEYERRHGIDVIKLHLGEPFFGPPPEVAEALIAAVREGRTGYTSAEGAPWLRTELAAKVARVNGIDTTPERVFVSPGSCQGLAALMQSMVEPGAELLLPALHWPIHLQQCLLAGFRPVFYPLDADYRPDVEQIRAVATPATRAILVNSPANPTGAVLDRTRMSSILDLARERAWRLISDEAYEQFVYTGEHLSFAALEQDRPPQDRIVDSVFTFSKGAAMTGMRLGYVVVANDRAADTLRVVQEASIIGSATPVQYAGLAALRQWDAGRDNAELVRGNRDGALPDLVDAGLLRKLPEGGWYAVLDVSDTGLDADAFADQLLTECGVAVAPATGFALRPELDPAGRVLSAPSAPWSRHLVRIAICGDPELTRTGVKLLVEFAAARTGA
jgi:aspartate aminotransferase